jgi:bacillithiol biosynthesis deacetylase BshB1
VRYLGNYDAGAWDLTEVDLLVFGPHPDDIEIGLGGAVAVHTARGDRVGLCDLTRGELGSNGTPEEREAEAEAARVVLGAAWRINLRWPDGNIAGTDAQIADVVRLVRQARPRAVAIPYWDDRHPDHRAASEVLRRAVFRSGLRRFALPGDEPSECWRPDWICFYFINDSTPVSFAIDVSAHYQRKRDALACHRSQFTPGESSRVDTRLTSPRFQQLIESRDAHLGALTGVAFAEGVVVKEPLLRESLFRLAGGANPGLRS